MPLQSRSRILPALSPDAIRSGNPHHPPRLSGIFSSQWRLLYRAQINAIFMAPVINVANTYRVSNDVFGYIFSQKSRKPTKLSFISLPLSPGNTVSPTKFGSLKVADHTIAYLHVGNLSVFTRNIPRLKRLIPSAQRLRPAGYNQRLQDEIIGALEV